MAELTPIERVHRTFDKEPVDVMPFFTGMGMVLLPPIKEMGVPFPKVHVNAEHLAHSGINSARWGKLDAIVVPYDMCWESEALGNKISLYEDSEDILYPTIPNKNWEEVEQVNITQDDIDNLMSRGRMPLIPEAFKIIKKEAPEYALGAWQLGPFTQCGQTIELDRVLKAVFKKKDLVNKILDQFTDMICNIAQTLQDAGADFFTLREPGVAADLLSPKTFKDMIMPRLTRILAAWKGHRKCLHICGSTDPICEPMWKCCTDSGTPHDQLRHQKHPVGVQKETGQRRHHRRQLRRIQPALPRGNHGGRGARGDPREHRRVGGCGLARLRPVAGHQAGQLVCNGRRVSDLQGRDTVACHRSFVIHKPH